MWQAYLVWVESFENDTCSNAQILTHTKNQVAAAFTDAFQEFSLQTCTVQRLLLVENHCHRQSIMALWDRMLPAEPGMVLPSVCFSADASFVQDKRRTLDALNKTCFFIPERPLTRMSSSIDKDWLALTIEEVKLLFAGNETNVQLPSGESACSIPESLCAVFLESFHLAVDNKSALMQHFMTITTGGKCDTALLSSNISDDASVLVKAAEMWSSFYLGLSRRTIQLEELERSAGTGFPGTVLDLLLEEDGTKNSEECGLPDLLLLPLTAGQVPDPNAWVQHARVALNTLRDFLSDVRALVHIVDILTCSRSFLRPTGVNEAEVLLVSLGSIKEQITNRGACPLNSVVDRDFPWPSSLLIQAGHGDIVATLMGGQTKLASDLNKVLQCFLGNGNRVARDDGKILLDWLRSIEDDDTGWENTIEEARNCDQVRCPPELWGTGKSDLYQNLATLTVVRNGFFHLFYPDTEEDEGELLFERLGTFLGACKLDLKKTTGVDSLLEKFRRCSALSKHYQILLGACLAFASQLLLPLIRFCICCPE
jgi:hypothetical protein